jgi:hypothetical protein
MLGNVYYMFIPNLKKLNDEGLKINIPYHPHRKNLHL